MNEAHLKSFIVVLILRMRSFAVLFLLKRKTDVI